MTRVDAKASALTQSRPASPSALRPRHVAELLLLSLIWGAAYLFTRSAVPAFGPVTLIALRMGIAALMLLPLLIARGGAGVLRRHAGLFAIQGTAFTALSFVLIAWSALTLSAGLTAILNATAPMFGAVVAWAWLGERIGRWRVLGLVVGMLGVAVLFWGKVSLRMDSSSVTVSLSVLAGLGSSLVWGMAANFSRVRMAGLDPLAVTVGTMLAAALALAPFAWAEWHGVWGTARHTAPGLRPWLEAIFLGVASSGLGMLMYFRLLREVGTVPTMSVTFLNPVVAIVSGALYLGEAITLQMLAGCAVVLAGTALAVGLLPRHLRR
ncbi:MAG TPA: DMT family transporter [Burkholderiaceae bacterium]|nr:DMT family transporter [Burkholderiaceae bacterium]